MILENSLIHNLKYMRNFSIKFIMLCIITIVLIIVGGFLAFVDRDGWGWCFFIAFVLGYSLYEKYDE